MDGSTLKIDPGGNMQIVLKTSVLEHNSLHISIGVLSYLEIVVHCLSLSL